MKLKAIISTITILLVVLMALSTIPAATSDTSSSNSRARDVDWNTNIALYAKAAGSPGTTPYTGWSPYQVQRWNDMVLYGQNAFVWCNGLGYGGNWMEYSWPTPVTIGGFAIWQFRPTGTRQLIGAADMQYWGGMSWISIGGYHAIKENLYTVGKPYYKELPQPVTTTKFRLVNLIGYAYPSGQVSNPSVSEWQVFPGTSGIPADVRMEPQSLNLDSNGNYVQVKVEGFPDNPDYSPMDVDGSTVQVGGVNVDLKYGTYNNNRWIGKADRLLVEDSIGSPGATVEVEVRGSLMDNTGFNGVAEIKAV
jgi:hypothetical protein